MRNNYKYSLDKSSKKFNCPNCNRKTFVKFVDNETKLYLNDTDGRCDRENKCGYFKKPSKNYNFICNTKVVKKVLQHSYHNSNIVLQFNNKLKYSNLILYLFSVYDRNKVLNAIALYRIGVTNYWNGATVFWQIDEKNRVRAGKIMLYNAQTGKRVKKPYNHISWIHKELKIRDFVLQQCLFGLQTLDLSRKDKTICVVESEKTAIIMSIVIPDFTWLATGSKTAFKESMLQPLKEYNIIAYPDKSEFDAWNTTAQQLNRIGFNIVCSSFLENKDLEQGSDLEDYIK